MSGRHDIDIRALRGLDGLEAIASDWRTLALGMTNARPWHFPEWHKAFASALAPSSSEFLTLTGRNSGQLQFIVPLITNSRRLNGRNARLIQIPYHPHAQFGDAVAIGKSVDSLTTLLTGLQSPVEDMPEFDILNLPMFLDDARIAQSLAHNVDPERITIETLTHADFLNVPNYDTYLDGLSKNFRANLRKARNKLMAAGTVEHVVARHADSLRQAVDDFLQLEKSGWKGTKGTSTAISMDQSLVRFYHLLAEGFGTLGMCEVHQLRLNGQTIASNFCLVSGETCHILKIAYDESRSAMAPGNMLLEHVLKGCSADGRVHTVHLMSDAGWHEDWKCSNQSVMRAEIMSESKVSKSIRRRRAFQQRMKPILATGSRVKSTLKHILVPLHNFLHG
ncbi:MAG TPA: GNAT family N-acetyltransferase [Phycisphaerales bacterium]|nr:GNAT family N-acetyltransferase [Phycisphaerales bacterium]